MVFATVVVDAETVLVKATEKLLGGDGLVRSPRRLLGTLVLTGLWSGYREDRESAMTVLLRLDLITRVVGFVTIGVVALIYTAPVNPILPLRTKFR